MLTKTPIRTVFHRQPATQPRRVRLADAAMQAGAIELMGARMSFTANAEIYGENEPADIADYLGLTIETVSRTLKHLEDAAAIEVPKRRRILLRNRSALRRLNARRRAAEGTIRGYLPSSSNSVGSLVR